MAIETFRRDQGRRWSLVAVAAVGVLVATVLGSTGGGPDGSPAGATSPSYEVTFAARACPTYTAITANRARNNLMESLRDLGANTPYSGDQAVTATVEATVQPDCTPITNWRFTLGNGIAGQVSGDFGSLSVVSSPQSPNPTTLTSTPQLDTQGNPTGKQIGGAVTVTLTPTQVQMADQHSLWVQGGTPTDPLLDAQFPSTYAFGALRCAIDNVNGDNVEYIAFPQGVTHVFCFAYYVQPPPTAGTIVVTKQLNPTNTTSQTFSFTGNVSYNPGGAFTLAVVNGAPASETFYRAAGTTPWTVSEEVPVNWKLTSLKCTSKTRTSTTVTTGPLATIKLAAGDVVTCVYTDAPIPPASLTVRKVSLGGVGTFPFTISSATGTTTVSATTTEEGVAVDTAPTSLTKPGKYTITEHVPTAAGGTWSLTSVECDGTDYTPSGTSVTITAVTGTEPVCTFVDTFTPKGSITVSKVMIGQLGSVEFSIDSDALPGIVLLQHAAPTEQGVATLATGDDTSALPLGTYTIEELAPAGQSPTGWSLAGVTCNGSPVIATKGAVTVTLTTASPGADCTFTDDYTALTGSTPTTTTTTVAPATTTTAATVTPTTVPPAELPVAPAAPITPVTVAVTG